MKVARKVQEFFETFRKVVKPGQWVVESGGYIRHKNGWCPLAFCASRRDHKLNTKTSVELPARRLGLSYRQGVIIARAADNDILVPPRPSVQIKQYRKKLLAAITQ